jgi:hypothetical protein
MQTQPAGQLEEVARPVFCAPFIERAFSVKISYSR